MKLASLGILICCVLSGCGQAQKTVRVCFSNTLCIAAEVAVTREARERGLMGREELREKEGMLFVFQEEGQHDFWMKNMRFPLDIIWVGKGKAIVDIKENALPCGEQCPSLVPQGASLYTIEVVSGFVAKHRLKAGDRINFTLP